MTIDIIDLCDICSYLGDKMPKVVRLRYEVWACKSCALNMKEVMDQLDLNNTLKSHSGVLCDPEDDTHGAEQIHRVRN